MVDKIKEWLTKCQAEYCRKKGISFLQLQRDKELREKSIKFANEKLKKYKWEQ